MHMFPNAHNRGPRKIQKIVQKCTKMDFLTPKCVKEPPKPPAPLLYIVQKCAPLRGWKKFINVEKIAILAIFQRPPRASILAF